MRTERPVATENRRFTRPIGSPKLRLVRLKWLSVGGDSGRRFAARFRFLRRTPRPFHFGWRPLRLAHGCQPSHFSLRHTVGRGVLDAAGYTLGLALAARNAEA